MSEMADQLNHISNGMHLFERQFIRHFFGIASKWRTVLSECGISKNSKKQSFKLVHSIYELTDLAGQL